MDELEADFLFGVDRFESALDAGGETVEFTHDLGHEGNRGFEDVFDAEAHGLVEEEFHLQEAQLLVDDLVDEDMFGWSYRLELIEEVGDDAESEVVVVDEAVEVFEAVEAVLERVGCRADLASGGSGASRFFGIGTVSG